MDSKKVASKLIDEKELNSVQKKYLSLILLAVASGMAFFSYVEVGFFWDTEFSFKPGAMATMFALSIVLPLYVRGTLKWNTSPYTII